MGTVLKIYSVKKDLSTWLHFIRKAKNIHSELQTCTFVVDLEWKLFLTYVVTFHQRGLLCTFFMYMYKLATFWEVRVEVRQNVHVEFHQKGQKCLNCFNKWYSVGLQQGLQFTGSPAPPAPPSPPPLRARPGVMPSHPHNSAAKT